MDISHTSALERIARVLSGLKLSSNANGQAISAGAGVDQAWQDHLADATAVLKALREPDARMASVGDAGTWTRMVSAGLGEPVQAPSGEPRSWSEQRQIYQKPLG